MSSLRLLLEFVDPPGRCSLTLSFKPLIKHFIPKSGINSHLLNAAVCLALAGPARAETLYDAFRCAHDGNAVIGAQRAAVGVSKQDRNLTATGFAPSVTASTDYGYEDTKGSSPLEPLTDSKTHPRGYGVSLTQNIWNGFKTLNGVRRDDAYLRAANDTLGNVEQNVLIDVVSAYADVLRDRAIVALRQSDLTLLQERAKQTTARFKLGELTRTDVDQSEASLARSRADLTVALSNVEASAAAFRAVTGHDPGHLDPPAVPDALIPGDLGAAIAAAQAENPGVLAARNAARAAEINIDVEKGGFAPTVDFTASAQHRYDPDYYPAKTDLVNLQFMGKISIPLYDKGVTYASVSRASELASQRKLELDHDLAQIRANVVQARGLYNASKLVIASAQAQIAASERALYGVELEATAGQRTTLDILVAQRSLYDARVNREIAEHDRIIAGYRLLAAIGRLSLARLTPADTVGREAKMVLRRTMPLSPRAPAPVPDEPLGLRPSLSSPSG